MGGSIMSLPNMSAVLKSFEQDISILTVTTTTVDFVSTDTVTSRDIRAVVQVAEKEKLSPDNVDWSLEYLMVHASVEIAIGEYVQYESVNYKVIDRGNWTKYGYYEVLAEETKEAFNV